MKNWIKWFDRLMVVAATILLATAIVIIDAIDLTTGTIATEEWFSIMASLVLICSAIGIIIDIGKK